MGWQKDVSLKRVFAPSTHMEPRFAQQNLPIRRDPSSRKRPDLPFSKPPLGTGFAGLGFIQHKLLFLRFLRFFAAIN
jgi:hypothetical protein